MNFDNSAKNWDTQTRLDRAGAISERVALELKAHCGAVLEYGCGTGMISFELADTFSSITLMDSSSGMLEVVLEKIASSGKTNMTPMLFDLACSKFDGEFDAIFTSMALHHIKDVQKILSAFFSLLKESGKLCIIEIDSNADFHSFEPNFEGHHGFSHSQMHELLSTEGFLNIEIATFYNSIKPTTNTPYSLFYASATKTLTTKTLTTKT